MLRVTTVRLAAEAGGVERAGALPASTELLVGFTLALCSIWALPTLFLGTVTPTLLMAAPEVKAEPGAAVTAPGTLRFTFAPAKLLL